MTNKRKGKVGSSFDAFLAEQGILEECEEQAVKQILADQIKAAMEKDRLTKAAMAILVPSLRTSWPRSLLRHQSLDQRPPRPPPETRPRWPNGTNHRPY